MIYINQSAIKKDEREIDVKGQVITWDHLLEQQHEIVFHTFQTAVDCVEMLLPSDYRCARSHSAKLIKWSCKDFVNCPFDVMILPVGKNSEFSAEEVKKGEFFIKKISGHDHSVDTILKPSVSNGGISRREEKIYQGRS